ncbi:protein of unknown function DUF214 [Fibrella aestuarina BUZ 2]|uniref:Macrolide export ATP-binding/permease protein macB n=1 Tax=Fibrella aestuarina BUZ 2 TaxID=1166018 RepID=I0K252_9BACT|nr:ABC transporter permease [Fibrella aestuarina]CCG98205.1 protein of unknown function DUF214 [Fibrella aestuarina BUZ 2]
MLRNYITIAWRNLWKHKLFTFINIVGLASGLMVCLLAMAHIRGAFTYDTFHANRARIVRLQTEVTDKNNDVWPYATSPMPLADVLKRDYGLVDETARLMRTYGEITGNTRRLQLLSYAVDPSFFHLFSYPLAQGQPATQPGTVVITQQTAARFFGTANPIGQVLTQEGMPPAVVTGILAEMPTPSHLRFDLLFSLAPSTQTQQPGVFQDWRAYQAGYTYALLKPGATAAQLEAVLPTLTGRVLRNLSFQHEKGYSLQVQPLTGLSPSYNELMLGTYEPQIGGLLVELGVGLLTLLMAAFNYINLTLARSLARAREVGIRKVAGALRWQLLGQFMAESVILSLLALGLATLLLEWVRPMAFVQQWMLGALPWDVTLWGVFVLFSVGVGLLAGFVPARVLSGFQPAQVLRSHTGLRVIRGISLRKALIVAQFSISLVAMIALLTMIRQMDYMATADYGFRRDRILNLPLNAGTANRLAGELGRRAGVERVTFTSGLFGSYGSQNQVKRQRNGPDSMQTFTWSVDNQFVPAMNLQLLAGQNLPPLSADSLGRQVLLNEEAVRAFRLGDPREAVGQTLWLNDSTDVRIVGVLRDFRFTTFSWTIKPLLLRTQPADFRYLSVAVAAGAEASVMAAAQRTWKRVNPYDPFAGQWYDDFLRERHRHDEDTDFMSLLLGLAFSIAGLGLFGMVNYTTQTRLKEIGIRKVMGAGVAQIVWLLSRGFVQWLALAAAIALPLGYLAGYSILIMFAYHVTLGLETLGVCLGVLLLIGSLTISGQTYRAAQMNPVKSLRSE